MKNVSIGRMAALAATTAASMVALSLPASALGISLNASAVAVKDCRTVAFTRAANYDLSFSSNTTGELPVKAGGVVDGSITLCWDLRAHVLTDVNVSAMTDATVNGVVSGLLTQTDASKVCSSINLVLAGGVTGTVSATSHAHVSVNGAPPADWDHDFAKDLSVSPNGENIVLKSCFDSSGNVTTT